MYLAFTSVLFLDLVLWFMRWQVLYFMIVTFSTVRLCMPRELCAMLSLVTYRESCCWFDCFDSWLCGVLRPALL
jgi:hypothetical protein